MVGGLSLSNCRRIRRVHNPPPFIIGIGALILFHKIRAPIPPYLLPSPSPPPPPPIPPFFPLFLFWISQKGTKSRPQTALFVVFDFFLSLFQFFWPHLQKNFFFLLYYVFQNPHYLEGKNFQFITFFHSISSQFFFKNF